MAVLILKCKLCEKKHRVLVDVSPDWPLDAKDLYIEHSGKVYLHQCSEDTKRKGISEIIGINED